jgi:hypothetical protein
MAGRRGWGEDSIYFDHSGESRDPDNHRHCPGRWRGVVSLKSGPDGKRRRKKVSGRNKAEVRAKLAELHDELNDGVVSEAGYTVAQAMRDYLADGLPGRAPKTIRTRREILEPLFPILGNVPLRELTAVGVRSALIKLATTRATRTVSMTHAALARAIRHALYAYVVLSLLVGLRTEEARALRWITATLGTRLDAGNARRSLRAICRKAGIGENWTLELRHTFVSLLSGNGLRAGAWAER